MRARGCPKIAIVKSIVGSGRDAEMMECPQLYPVCEVFAGVHSICRSDGFGFEHRKCRTHNIHTIEGLTVLIVAMACTVPFGLLWMAPTCASWLSFVSISTSKRSADLWFGEGRTLPNHGWAVRSGKLHEGFSSYGWSRVQIMSLSFVSRKTSEKVQVKTHMIFLL